MMPTERKCYLWYKGLPSRIHVRKGNRSTECLICAPVWLLSLWVPSSVQITECRPCFWKNLRRAVSQCALCLCCQLHDIPLSHRITKQWLWKWGKYSTYTWWKKCNGEKKIKCHFVMENIKITNDYMERYSKKLLISKSQSVPQWNNTFYPL